MEAALALLHLTFCESIVKEPVLVGQSETSVHGLSAFDRATGPTFNDSFMKDLFNLCPKP